MFIVGMLLVFFQNFVGINTIIYYAPTLLTNIGFGESGAILANVGIGAINMLVTIVALSLIDRLGRKPLLLAGAVGMTLGMVLLAVVNLLGQHGGTLLMGVTLLGIAIYIASFAVSWVRRRMRPSRRGSSGCTSAPAPSVCASSSSGCST